MSIGDMLRVKLDLPHARVTEIRSGPDELYTIIAGGMEFYVDQFKPIYFPRRTGMGEPKIWPREGINPVVNDLAIHDVLLPNVHEPEQSTIEWIRWKRRAQVVTGLFHVFGGNKYCVQTEECGPEFAKLNESEWPDHDPQHVKYQFIVRPGTIMTFPRPTDALRAMSAHDPEDMVKAGPYESLVTPGVVYYFLVHPTGRGRWPNCAPPFESMSEPGEYTSRPPSHSSEWKKVIFKGGPSATKHSGDLTRETTRARYQQWKSRPDISHPLDR